MVSIVTVIHKRRVFEEWLKKSILEQNMSDYEVIEIDNTCNQYKSLAEAYNNAIKKCSGKWIMFSHPDIFFLRTNEVERLIEDIETLSNINKDFKVFGVAGIKGGSDVHSGISSIFHGEDKRGGKEETFDGKKYQEVQTIDACCYVIKKNYIERLEFWNDLKGFHMCIEELCLRVAEEGGKIVVIPANIWHFSDGRSLDHTYYRETIRVLRRHYKIKYFNTTCFQWKVNSFIYIKLRFFQIRNYLHHKIIK